MANRSGPASIEELAKETGAHAVEIGEVVNSVDVIVLAVPQSSLAELPKDLLKKAKSDVIVLDCTNYFPQWFGKIDELENGVVESVWVQNQIGHPVIKVFNTILAASLANSPRPSGDKRRLALSIFGDNSNDKERIAKLVDSVGFEPVVCGLIEESWRAQPGSPIYCTDLNKEKLLHWCSRVNRDILPAKRDANIGSVMSLPQTASWEDHVKAIRDVVLPGEELQ